MIPVRDLLAAVEERVQAGFLYGDGQYSTDIDAENPSHPCVFSCYRPVEDKTPISPQQNAGWRGMNVRSERLLLRHPGQEFSCEQFDKRGARKLSARGLLIDCGEYS